jgi:hypothetical protein
MENHQLLFDKLAYVDRLVKSGIDGSRRAHLVMRSTRR